MVKNVKSWQMLLKQLPANIHNFCRRYLIMSLDGRWNITNSELCSLCLKMQTQLHVFNLCSDALDRYAWRHESIIQTFSTIEKSFVWFSFICWYGRLRQPGNIIQSSSTKYKIFRTATEYTITPYNTRCCYRN